jgi:hypothetical protein
VADQPGAKSLATGFEALFLDRFVTLQQSRSGDVFRGVAFAPRP